jgi:hypothetical protein
MGAVRELPELDRAPEVVSVEGRLSTAHSVYLSAASAWHASLRRAAEANGNGDSEAAQQAVTIAQAAYLEARDGLEAARRERDEIRHRLAEERMRELKVHALAEALARQERMREASHRHKRGFFARLFGRR